MCRIIIITFWGGGEYKIKTNFLPVVFREVRGAVVARPDWGKYFCRCEDPRTTRIFNARDGVPNKPPPKCRIGQVARDILVSQGNQVCLVGPVEGLVDLPLEAGVRHDDGGGVGDRW